MWRSYSRFFFEGEIDAVRCEDLRAIIRNLTSCTSSLIGTDVSKEQAVCIFQAEVLQAATDVLEEFVGNSDWLRTGRRRGRSSSAGRVKNFPSLISNEYRGLFPWGKAAGA
jgi:hypothetical protein